MRWSQAFIPTLRDDPADAEAPSHRLMVRAGLVRQLAAGIYSYLPLGQLVLRKVAEIIREEMEAIGAREFSLPVLLPAQPWRESGRWDEIGHEMFRLQDRKHGDMCLGMTHEEIFTTLSRDFLRSYKQLPQIWYQIQLKFRDEPRPKSGVLRGRQFTMKDAYSFDLDAEGLDRSFQANMRAYTRIFSRCGIESIPVEASSGIMGGSESTEFMAITDSGEDWVVTCPGCGYAANLEKARSVPGEAADGERANAPEKFATPGIKTIEELASTDGGAPADQQIKTLAYVVGGELMLFCLRGDHELNDVKVCDQLGSTDLRPGRPDEIRAALGAAPGSLGAVGVTELKVHVDLALEGRSGLVTGANEDGFHLRHIDIARDLPDAVWLDLRNVEPGDACAECGKPLELRKAVEIGHVFKLGTRFSEPMGARVLTADGVEVPIVMGSYGIGLDRIIAAAIEAHHDDDGIVWPRSIAPYDVVVTPLRVDDDKQMSVAIGLYDELREAGFDALLDDRDERPGVKFKDADLIGIPFRIVPGPRALAKGCVELFCRRSRETSEVVLDQVVAELRGRTA